MRHDLDNLARTAETLRKKEQSMSFVRNYGRWTPGGLVLFAVMSSLPGAATAYGVAVGAGKALTYAPFVRWLSDTSRSAERELASTRPTEFMKFGSGGAHAEQAAREALKADPRLVANMKKLQAVIAGARDPETKAAITEYAHAIERELGGGGE